VKCGYPLAAPAPGQSGGPAPPPYGATYAGPAPPPAPRGQGQNWRAPAPPQYAPPPGPAPSFPGGEEVPRAVYIPNAGSSPAGIELEEEFSGDTMVLDAMDEADTTVLDDILGPRAFLIRSDTREEIAVTGAQFTIGRSRANADYYVGDNSAISRIHAVILSQGGRYYLIDLNSSNKTFLNDFELAPNQSVEIAPGARVRLADMEFIFEVR
jgi:hypothetical protein